jgi:hypothetical protein
MESYLKDRTQTTIINNKESELEKVTIGIPQGTILGPKLFVLYINDLLTANFDNIILFADDALLLFELDYINKEFSQNILLSINKIYNWLTLNLLLLNEQKSNYMIYAPDNSTKHNIPDNVKLGLTFRKKTLHYTDNTKYLGLLCDNNLNWTKHIHNLSNKIKYLIRQSFYLSNLMNLKIKLMWFYASVYSYVALYILHLYTTNKSNLSKLSATYLKLIKTLFYPELKKFRANNRYKTSRPVQTNNNIIKRLLISFMESYKIQNYNQIYYLTLGSFIKKTRIKS